MISHRYLPPVAMRLPCLVFAAALLATSAQAAEDPSPRRRQSPYLRLFTGIGVTRPSSLKIRQPTLGTDLTFEQVSWEHKSLSTDWDRDSIPYVGVRGGFFFMDPSWLSLSLEVVHFKVFAKEEERYRIRGRDRGLSVDTIAPMDQFLEQYQVSNGVNLVLSSVQAHKRFARSSRFTSGRVDLFAGVGAGVTIPFTRSVVRGQAQGQYEWGRLASQLHGGVAWHLSPRWDLATEYKFTTTTVNGSIDRGDSRARLHTHHLVFGFGLHLQ